MKIKRFQRNLKNPQSFFLYQKIQFQFFYILSLIFMQFSLAESSYLHINDVYSDMLN